MRRIAGVVAILVAASMIGAAPTATAQNQTENAKAAKAGQGHKKPKRQVRRRAVVPSTATIFRYIKDLTSVGYRRTGSKASLRAAKYVRDSFRRFGLRDVGFQTVRSYAWKVKDSSLSVAGIKRDSFPIAHAFMGGTRTGRFGTGAKGITAPVVDVGDGNQQTFAATDVKGKVVMFDLRFTGLPADLFRAIADFYYDPDETVAPGEVLPQPYLTNFVDVVQRAMDGGAVGVVGVLADYFDSKYYFNEEYRRLQMTVPGMWVTKSEGDAIRAQLAADPSAQAKLVMNGERRAAPARNVIGYLPGRSRQTLLISSHHDAVWDGAVEDGSGTAEVLALAKYFGALPKKRRPMSLMFATMDSHFSGYQAHQKFIRKYVTGVPEARRPRVNFAIEHIARYGKVVDGKLKMTDLPEVAGILQNVGEKPLQVIKDAVVRNDLDRTIVIPATMFGESLPTDASFAYAAGVPVVSLISGPIYLYDRQDTLDKVYKPHLRPMALAYKEMVNRMSRMPLSDLPGDPPVAP
ncbi:MAG: M28 family peptidase [Solirubrobacterales bacterium]|nr:M28 family peptidase [Solirubrobacterales bacterium]